MAFSLTDEGKMSPLRRKNKRDYDAMRNTVANLRSYKTMEVLIDSRNYRYLLNMNHSALENFCKYSQNELICS